MNNKLDTTLKTIKNLEEEKNLLEEKIKQERQLIFNILEEENIGQYKNELAVVSYVERKILTINNDKALEEVKDLPKYFNVIPEYKELNKIFKDDVKNGKFKSKAVDIETKKAPMIRFKK